MLTIVVSEKDQWDETNQCFVIGKRHTLQLEHSLISISKWESKWNKSFVATQTKTIEETIDYVKCMTLTQNIPQDIYGNLSSDNIERINEYISAPMTATWFAEDKNKSSNREVVTSELIYYWMIALNIPFECQKWHLNRLLTLIRVCSIKNQPSKKMGKNDVLRQNAALNEARRKRYNTRG